MKDTSWEQVAPWYDDHLSGEDTYHAKVILPNLGRILSLKGNEHVLDLACGQGFFTREIAKGAKVVAGADLSPSLIAYAREHSDKKIQFFESDATKLSFAKDKSCLLYTSPSPRD